MGLINSSIAMSEQECIDILTKMGVSITYRPRVILPESRGGEVVEMSVFEAVSKLNLWKKTDSSLNNHINT